MAEILNPDEVLARLRGMSPLRRILLSVAGTLQTTLSAYFGESVDVEVLSQSEGDEGENIFREIQLVCRERRIVACRAWTRIEVRNDVVRKLIRERRMGLGQICEALGLRATFVLDAAGHGDGVLWREYRLEGSGFSYHIREELPARLYGDGGPGPG